MCESHGWLHSALSKPLFLPCFYPRNSQPKNEGSIPLNSPVERGRKIVFRSFLGFTDNSRDTTQPRISAAIVLCMLYSSTYTSICPRKKRISDMTSVWVFFFLEIWLFIFSLEGPECLSKVSALGFWETYPCGMSVTFHSPQVNLGNFHIMAFVDRLLGLTVNMFEKLSSWWKKIKERASLHLKQHVKL